MASEFAQTLLGERYRCTSPLLVREGREVWLAEDTWAPGVRRVLKIARGLKVKDVEAHRLRNEFRVLSDVIHPSIPRLCDFGFDAAKGICWLALEEVSGEVLGVSAPLPPSEVIAIARDVLRALDTLHARDLAHLDVKPANIVFDRLRGRATLIDYDLCTRPEAAEGRGTRPFAAPEIQSGVADIGVQADFYSLGVTLFLLLGGNIEEAQKPLVSGLNLPDRIPPQLRELVRDLTRARPFDRIPNARRALSVLNTFEGVAGALTVESVRARISHPPFVGRAEECERLAKLVRRGPGPLRAAATVLTSLSGGGASRLLLRARRDWLEEGARVITIGATPSRRSAIAVLLDLIARIAPGLGLAGVDAPAGAEEIGESSRREMLRWLSLANRQHRLVLVFEDCHLFDAASRRFLKDLLETQLADFRQKKSAKALTVVFSRDPLLQVPDPFQQLLQEAIDSGELDEIWLAPLSDQEAQRLLLGVTAPEELSGAVLSEIIERAGGYPGLMRLQLAESLNGATRLVGLAAAIESGIKPRVIPYAVQSIASAYCANLDQTERELLSLIADSPEGLSEMEARSILGREIVPALHGLARRRALELYRNRYRIRASLLAQALREELKAERDRRDHDAVADILAQVGTPLYVELCHRMLSRSAPNYFYEVLATGRKLRREGRHREELALFSELVDLERSSPFASRIARLESAHSLLLSGRTIDAAESLRKIAGGDYAAVRIRAQIHRQRGERAVAQQRLQALTRHRPAQIPREAAELQLDLAELAFEDGDLKVVLTHLQSAADLVPHRLIAMALGTSKFDAQSLRGPWPGDDAIALGRFLRVYGRVLRQQQRPEDSVFCLRAAVKIFSRAFDGLQLGGTWNDLGVTRLVLGDLPGALRDLRRARRIRHGLGDLRGMAEVENNLGAAHRRAGNADEAIACFQRAHAMLRRIGDHSAALATEINIATVDAGRRELQPARVRYERAISALHWTDGADRRIPVLLNNLGVVATLEARYEEALARFTQAERRYRTEGQTSQALLQHLQMAEIALFIGDLPRAETNLALARGHEGKDSAQRLKISAMIKLARREPQNEVLKAIEEAAEAARGERSHESLGLDQLWAEAWLAFGEPERALKALGIAADPAGLSALFAEEGPILNRCECEISAVTMRLSTEAIVGCGMKLPPEFWPALDEVERRVRHAGMPRELLELARLRAQQRRGQRRIGLALTAYESALEALERILVHCHDATLLESFLQSPLVQGLCDEVRDFATAEERSIGHKLQPSARRVVDEVRHNLFNILRAEGEVRGDTLRRDEFIRPFEELLRGLNSAKPERLILRDLVETVVDFLRAERAFLVTLDVRGNPRVAVACAMDRLPIEDPDRAISQRVIRLVLETGRPLLTDDATDDELLNSASALNLQLRSILCTPLRHAGELLGLLYLDNRARREAFKDKDIEVLELFAMAAAATLVSARSARTRARSEKLQLLEKLAEDVSHRFNNLLTPIIGRTFYLTEQVEEGLISRKYNRDLQIILDAGLMAVAAVRRFLDYAQMRRDGQEGECDLDAVLRSTLEVALDHAAKIRRRTGDLVNVYGEINCSDVFVACDEGELTEVLTSLLFNSIDALARRRGREGNLCIGASEASGIVTIAIEDDGSGYSEEEIEKLFDPYFGTSEDDQSGPSFNLSLVSGRVASFGGTLNIESKVGLGTRVSVQLPRLDKDRSAPHEESFVRQPHPFERLEEAVPQERKAATATAAPVVSAPEEPAGAVQSQGRILVVDDDHGVRELMVDILRRHDYEVVEAASGEEALIKQSEQYCPVVISDIGMAPMDGWQLARELKHREAKTRIVMISGWSARFDAAALEARGVDGLIGKPFQVKDFMSTIEAQFGRGLAPSVNEAPLEA